MTTSDRSWGWRLGIASWLAMGGASAISGDCAIAQITPDGTLGAESSIVTPNAGGVDVISGGATRGANLFHSFDVFSVPTGGAAFFNNGLEIQNIISRVTGGSISNIDGLLQANGTANLFLINPNGIIFGPNATLSIGGSFLASTASSLNFADGTEFSATNPKSPPLLRVSVPIGLQYGGTAGDIQVQQSILQVQSGQTLALMGGDVSVEGGEFGFFEALGGRVELGGLAGTGMVQIEGQQSEGAFRLTSLRFPDSVERKDVSLTNLAYVNVAASGGGSIAINARNFNLSEQSNLVAGIEEGLGAVGSQAGAITVNATDAITVGQSSNIENSVGLDATGNSGDINIKAEGNVYVTDGSSIFSYTEGQGDAGSISVQANGNVSVTDVSSIYSSTEGQGDAGSISVQANGNVSVTDVSSIYSSTDGQGDSEGISVQAKGDISFSGDFLGSSTFISSSTYGQGDAGGILLQANGNISITNTPIDSYTIFGEGDAGGILLQANGNISITNTPIASNTNGQGDGGDILLQANGNVSMVNSTINSDTNGEGDAGDIHIQARSLSMTSGASLRAVTRRSKIQVVNFTEDGAYTIEDVIVERSGNAGNIEVDAVDSVTLSGIDEYGSPSGLFTDTQAGGSRPGGEITVRTGSLRILNGAVLSAITESESDGGKITANVNNLEIRGGGQLLTTAYSSGDAGSITVNATGSITLSGSDPTYFDRLADSDLALRVATASPSSGVFANTALGSTGQGGDLTIITGQLQVQDGAQVSASTAGAGRGGSLAVNAPTGFVQLIGSGSGLFAQSAATGSAGNLTITTGQLQVQDGAEVTVSGQTGFAGNLTATAQAILLDQGKLTAVAGGGSGGNIRLQMQDLLLMRDHSLISAEALSTANGGNININTDFIVALPGENSDIIANAFEGNGGNIDITTQGIFGTQFREQRTRQSDITASSDFGVQGVVEINTPDIDPSRALVNLPAELVDASNQIAQSCPSGVRQGKSKFVLTGRGGLPPSPSETLSSDAVWIDLDLTTQSAENRPRSTEATKMTNSTAEPLVEATGWAINDKGQVVLTASVPTATPYSPELTTAQCHVP